MSDFGWQLRLALTNALEAIQPPLADGRIFASVAPKLTAFPHVEIGATQAIADDTSAEDDDEGAGAGDDGIVEYTDLHVYDRGYDGPGRALAIAGQIHVALHGATLQVEGRTSAFAWVDSRRSFVEPDGETQHAVITVRVHHRS